MEQPDWMTHVGTTIAREVRRYRLARGMSAQQLSDACEKLGAPIPRTVISNIENGRRTNISVAETIVLARALRVPPIALIYPAGYEEELEYVPGKRVDPMRAVKWFSGEMRIDERSGLNTLPDPDWALTISRQHRNVESRISDYYRSANEERINGSRDTDYIEQLLNLARNQEYRLKAMREEMVRRGLTPPKTYLKVDDLPPSDAPDKNFDKHWAYEAEFPLYTGELPPF
ncbi:helix-turn-helix transcriptional regulator [Streptomyces sp. NBC_01622]|uniref:helix-turn-helix domain-containing protein n=1 Tax=Streptomyces sp. NBC_01622 TaxID=2975903 RepID=UPI00386AD800|nr:helix-turn-helix transcriptional regulator [Streptomyces sp. NBC_01622]